MMLTIFQSCHAHRKVLLKRTDKDEKEDKKERKSSVKHCDRKYTAVMISEQSIQLSLHYMKLAIEYRISPDVIKANQIVAIDKQGMKTLDEEFTEKKMDHALSRQQKNLKSDRRTIMMLDEHRDQAKIWKTKHDAV